ncbi:ATP-dependent Clp protease adaptor ClpS [Campylobacter geochelonis]|uniref:ATP-dependent Clp protease adaptor ClpS n=1 Tax=Campylobacter geochelonis TaxID=1780362 RepID=UPI0007708F74|nr:ATP-dependent Clp protease adaptor ClpS [Campylobacter geochelonis]CZE47542.1 ATP-dependent Clp protease adaptor protein ClpS [Campylobacter geochelonis]CZE50219.1 ATP-dependent Clp protease adaptor protein ClpS [Campylobacter geochelonis]
MPTKGEVLEKTKTFLPELYNVILHNDDKTTMDFVIEILMSIFNKSFDDAAKIMLEVHNHGNAVCATYTKEIALSKQRAVIEAAKAANFPLKCTIEKE